MNRAPIGSAAAPARRRHGDVAIRILSCDFPRGYLRGALGWMLVLFGASVVALSAQAGGRIAARARVLSAGAAQEAERVAAGMERRPQGTPADADWGGAELRAGVELYANGAWIRLEMAPKAGFGGDHRISIVYLSN